MAQGGIRVSKRTLTTESGTPQGGIISPVLANMALDGLEAMLARKISNASGQVEEMNMRGFVTRMISLLLAIRKSGWSMRFKLAVVDSGGTRASPIARRPGINSRQGRV